MSPHRVCAVALVGCILCATLAATAPATADEQDGPPSVPAAYYGEVTIDGEPAATGVEVEAEVNGEVRGSITVEDPGEYGEETAGGEQLYVEGDSDDEGTPVRFYLITTEGERMEVNETDPDDVTWSSGDLERIDLSVSTRSAEQPAMFTLSEVSLDPETITEGGTVTVNANVTNGGDLSGEQSVTFSVDDEVLADRTVDLEPGESRSLAFENVTVDRDPGDYEYTVRTDNETRTGTLTVEAAVESAYFNVTDVDPNEPTVEQGGPVTVTATIDNGRNATGEQTVRFVVDDRDVANRTVEVAGDETRTVTLENDSLGLEPASYEYAIRTDNETRTGTLIVEAATQPAYFEVTGVDPNEPTVEQGDPVTVTATIDNGGNATGEQTIRFVADDRVVANRTVEVAGDETRTVTLENDSLGLEPASYEYAIRTDNETRTGMLTVEPSPDPGFVAVSNLTPANPSVEEGGSITPEVTVRNTGDERAEGTVELRVGSEAIDNERVNITSNESRRLSFGEQPIEVGPGNYTYGVYSGDDDLTTTLTVDEAGSSDPGGGDGSDDGGDGGSDDGDDGSDGGDGGSDDGDNGSDDGPTTEPPALVISNLDPATLEAEQGETVTIAAAVENVDNESTTQNVTLEIGDGQLVERREITLAGGEETTVSFSGVDTSGIPTGETEYTVSTNDDRSVGTLTTAVEEETPGFTVLTAVLGITVVAVILRRRTRSG